MMEVSSSSSSSSLFWLFSFFRLRRRFLDPPLLLFFQLRRSLPTALDHATGGGGRGERGERKGGLFFRPFFFTSATAGGASARDRTADWGLSPLEARYGVLH